MNRSMNIGAAVAAVVAGVAGMASAQCGHQLLATGDLAGGDALAYALAMTSGNGSNTLLLGAPYDDNARGGDAGAVYAFTQSNQVWYEYAKLVPPANLPSGFFGSAVGIEGAEAVVAAQGAGRVYFFQRTGNVWGFHKEFLGSPAESFGAAAATSGTVAVVGAPFATYGEAGAGKISIYERDGSFTWFSKQTLGQIDSHRDANDWMGTSVATNGTFIFAGAPKGDSGVESDCGWVMVAKKDGPQWAEEQTLFPPGVQAGQRFGSSMDVDGDWLVIGAPYATVAGKDDAGLAYLYYFNGGYWQHVTTIQPYPVYAGATFGASVSISGDRLVVGAKGTESAFVFRQNAFAQWDQVARFTDPDSGADAFAGAVVVDADRVVVGDASYDAGGLTNAGAAYLYKLDPDVADTCYAAVEVSEGAFAGCTSYAVLDGSAGCGGLATAPDVYFRYVAPESGTVSFDAFGSAFDTLLSVHTECPASSGNEIACNDDWSIFEDNAQVTVNVQQGEEYILRLSGASSERGSFVLHVGPVVPAPCDADFNDDGTLNSLDFLAFLNAWNAQDNTADFNDDGAINTMDVLAYLNAYTAGC
ncbi:MAG TPA: GC-type dockerin domain-anchored protein [Phycisphaerales bacterium]|nr:GC-type dockerin domain-anchored protein [Phycisphaerales bacterium]